MLSKEEYLTHLDYGIKTCSSIYDAFKELIDEHFKLVEKHENLKEKCNELSNSNDILRTQLYFIEPYKFEDLKPNLWVWDDKEKVCIKLTKVDLTTFSDYFKGMCKNKRLYPVQMANSCNDKERK